MKRKMLIAGLCVVFLLILVVASGPLLVRLGLLKTVFYIQNDDAGRVRIVYAVVRGAFRSGYNGINEEG
jgi:hypothetical protein